MNPTNPNIRREINTVRLPIFGFGRGRRPERSLHRVSYGKGSGGVVEVIGASGLGVPLAKDYDVYIAVLSFVPEGSDTASFSLRDLLGRLSLEPNGRNYAEARESVSRLRATTIAFRRTAMVKTPEGDAQIAEFVETSLFEEVSGESRTFSDGRVVTSDYEVRLSRFFAAQAAAKYFKPYSLPALLSAGGPGARRMLEILEFTRNGRPCATIPLRTACEMFPLGAKTDAKRRETIREYLGRLQSCGAISGWKVSGQAVEASFAPAGEPAAKSAPAPVGAVRAAVLAAASGIPGAEALASVAERSGRTVECAVANLRAAVSANPRNIAAYYTRALAEDYASSKPKAAPRPAAANPRASAEESALAREKSLDRLFNAILDSMDAAARGSLMSEYGVDPGPKTARSILRIAMKRAGKFERFVTSAN